MALKKQTFARRLYLLSIVSGGGWVGYQIFGPQIVLDAEGLVVQDHKVLGTDFQAQVVAISKRPGDHVKRGEVVAQVLSSQMVNIITDLSNQQSSANNRLRQIATRSESVKPMLPIADERVTRTKAVLDSIEHNAAKGLATVTQRSQVTHDYYEAIKNDSDLRTEQQQLIGERTTILSNLGRLTTALNAAVESYHSGQITSPVEGVMGNKIAFPGTVLRPGEPLAEVYFATKYVVGYLPLDRFYSTNVGENVVVTDGQSRQTAQIEALGSVADTLPPEYQSNFRTIERRQPIRIELSNPDMFPLFAKVNVTGRMAPSNLINRVSTALAASPPEPQAKLAKDSFPGSKIP